VYFLFNAFFETAHRADLKNRSVKVYSCSEGVCDPRTPVTDRLGAAIRRVNEHPSPQPPTLIIGIGNDYRRDDAVGLIVARQLKARRLPGVTVLESTGEGANLMALWAEAEKVILIDAVFSGAPAGSLHHFDALTHPPPADFFRQSTHTLGLAAAIQLARALDCLPAQLTFYGIEGSDFSLGVGLSPQIEAAAPEVVARIASEIC
jgi:hydrogenase maturation protease